MMRAEQQKRKAIKDYRLACFLMMIMIAFIVGTMLYDETINDKVLPQDVKRTLSLGFPLLYFPLYLKLIGHPLKYPEDCD